MNHQIIKYMTSFILRNHDKFEWTIQGLGMLRVYITPELRLHVWHSSAREPGASVIHSHPWDFCSNVIAGCITDVRFRESADGKPHNKQVIRCGPGGGLEGDPQQVYLLPRTYRGYVAGKKYYALAEDIHYSTFDDGTVTLVNRTFKQDTEHAAVYWPEGEEWGTAEPRIATPKEVKLICESSLDKYFGGGAPV